jgi:adenine-specific DNA-methyltransferase
MVIPAELLHVSYAAELRLFLSTFFQRITVFTFKRLLFDEVEQEVVLLTADRRSRNAGIRVVELTDADDLRGQSVDTVASALKAMDHSSEKWVQYFLDPDELALVRALRRDPRFKRLGDFASVDVGVVTGMNDFFVLPATSKPARDLAKYLAPVVTRSSQLVGCQLTNEDWAEFVEAETARMLLTVKDGDPVDDAKLAEFIRSGVDSGIPTGYKCRIRRKWYVVPSTWRPSGFMLRQIHRYPKLVINDTDATSTDTVHRVAFNQGVDPRAVVGSFHNSATFLFAEVLGRSYGGGVLELEPSEAEDMPVPIRPEMSGRFAEVDGLLRDQDTNRLLDFADYWTLTHLGLSRREVTTLRRGWTRLRDRRLGRRRVLQPERDLVALV